MFEKTYESMKKADNDIDRINARLFSMAWFTQAYGVLLIPFIGEQKASLIEYIWMLAVFVTGLCVNHFKVNIRLFWFLFIYTAFLAVDFMLVSYKYFVMIEGCSYLIRMLTPLYILSVTPVNKFQEFFLRWYFYAKIHCALIVLYYILLRSGYIGYGHIPRLTTYLTVVLFLGVFVYRKTVRIGFILFLASFGFGLVYGSRMPSVAMLAVICFLLLVYGSRKWYFYFFAPVLLVIGMIVFYHLDVVFTTVNDFLLLHGIESRTFAKFASEFGQMSLLQMMESSQRDKIWPMTIAYLQDYCFFPGGFGRIRYISGGMYYYAHNLILDLLVFFGVFALPVVFAVICRAAMEKRKYADKDYLTLICCAVYFLVSSMTGAHFLGDGYAVFVWGALFFAKKPACSVRMGKTRYQE